MIPNPTDLVHPECPNFFWYEVWKSETASRLDIPNESSDKGIQQLAQQVTFNCLQPIRDTHGRTTVNSWYRGEALEREITKAAYIHWCRDRQLAPTLSTSWDAYFARKSHPKGGASDIEVAGVSNDDLYNWCRRNLDYDQLIREYPVEGVPNSGWVHISWSGTNNRRQAFKIGEKT